MLKIAFDKKYVLPLPEGHRFPMLKYELIPDQLLYEGLVSKEQFFSPKFREGRAGSAKGGGEWVGSSAFVNLSLTTALASKVGRCTALSISGIPFSLPRRQRVLKS